MKKVRRKWISIAHLDLVDILTGELKLELPEDAEVLHIRSDVIFGMVEFLVVSEKYPEVEIGSLILIERGVVTKETT